MTPPSLSTVAHPPLQDTYPGLLDVSAAGHLTGGDSSLASAIKELQATQL